MDIEEFIELVKKYPCLYDYKESLHVNKKEKDRYWEEIAAAMEITSEIAKNKWKNLRDNYAKHLKSTMPNSGPYSRYLHWTWASNMEFLKNNVNYRAVLQNHNQHHHNQDKGHKTDNIYSARHSKRLNDRFKKIPTIHQRQRNHIFTQDDCMTDANKILQDVAYGQDDEFDATELIFLGYAKAIKSLSVKRQAEIKLKIAKIISEEEIAQYEATCLFTESPVYYPQSPSPQNDPLNPKIIQIKSE